MTLHELHPEELIDKAERGPLEEAERAILDRHLAACAVCRFEMSAREDFRAFDRLNGSAFSEDAIDQIVGASLRGADVRDSKIDGNLRPISTRPRALQAGRRWAVLLAVAVLLVSAQATARWLGIRAPSWLMPSTMTTVTTNTAAAEDATKTASTASKMQPVAAATIPQANQSANETDVAPSTTDLSASNTNLTPVRSIPTHGAATTAPVINPAPIVRPDPSASALFSVANADREQGKHIVATREYRELLEDYPNAPEADLSRATLGRLLLDDGDATAALPLFDAYLKTGGPLREETMANRATALERLHRSSEEADAWQALLDAYPQSLHAERARQRLEELGAH
jgi:TolA-binding protein